ncbi:MAG TPA: hypothetical protein VLB29_03780 [Nocardioidaceae bacterium]|nr:hypothetical protein [Nocardioidaceae bacterium]
MREESTITEGTEKDQMGNVTLPTPVALAGGAICILGGYLLGVVAGPDTPSRTTAVVDSYDEQNGHLCLSGESVAEQEGTTEEGQLCGTWRRSVGDEDLPTPGDEFRFVSVVVDQPPAGESDADGPFTMIYGDVVR